MNLEKQEGLSENEGIGKTEGSKKPQSARYNPIKPKGDEGEVDWFSDRIPVRRKRSTDISSSERKLIEDIDEEDSDSNGIEEEQEEEAFEIEDIAGVLDEFNKIEAEEKRSEELSKSKENIKETETEPVTE